MALLCRDSLKACMDGSFAYSVIKDLFPLCRSITGPGVVETLRYFKGLLPNLCIYKIPTGTPIEDWIVPDEWSLTHGYIEDLQGRRIIDTENSNLHVIGYSQPVNATVSRQELLNHTYTLESMPKAIPYITSYYQKRWGFSVAYEDYTKLTDANYKVVIDSDHYPGHLTYADLLIPGSSENEIFFSTYICHPSMANNELSGPAVAATLATYLSSRPSQKYTYRFAFVPETIGAVAYISQNLSALKTNVYAGFVLTCVGDDRTYSYLPSKYGDTTSDKVALAALRDLGLTYKAYSWLDRGSDERQYCAPGVDLPVCSVMRSKYGTYPEYHTSLDNLEVVSPEGLQGSIRFYQTCIDMLETNMTLKATTLGEPFLSKHNLRSSLGGGTVLTSDTKLLQDVLSYCDGTNDTFDISNLVGSSFASVRHIQSILISSKIARPISG